MHLLGEGEHLRLWSDGLHRWFYDAELEGNMHLQMMRVGASAWFRETQLVAVGYLKSQTTTWDVKTL